MLRSESSTINITITILRVDDFAQRHLLTGKITSIVLVGALCVKQLPQSSKDI